MVQSNPSVREFQRGKLLGNEALRALPAHPPKSDVVHPEFHAKGMNQWDTPGIPLSPRTMPKQSPTTNTTEPAKTPHVSKWHSRQSHHRQLLQNQGLFYSGLQPTVGCSPRLLLPKTNRKRELKEILRDTIFLGSPFWFLSRPKHRSSWIHG